MTTWSDTPPTVAGTYWVKYGRGGREVVAVFDAEEWLEVGEFGSSCRPDEAAELVQFGRRVPTNAELGELPGLIEEYGLRCKAYGLAIQSLGSDEQFGLRMMRDEMLAKINAILGVRNDA